MGGRWTLNCCSFGPIFQSGLVLFSFLFVVSKNLTNCFYFLHLFWALTNLQWLRGPGGGSTLVVWSSEQSQCKPPEGLSSNPITVITGNKVLSILLKRQEGGKFLYCAIPGLFSFIFVFSLQLTVHRYYIKLVNNWIRTTDVCRKGPLYQLRHNHWIQENGNFIELKTCV